jgi:CBS domain-containing protein
MVAKSITLFIFGGVSNIASEAKDAATEFWVAIVGPLSSFVLAAVAYLVALAVDERRVDVVANYLVYINVTLGLFNLVPGFPLDGGRVLRALVWKVTGSEHRATVWASTGGKLVAWGMFGVGVLLLLDGQIIGGVWLAAIAWFLHSAASSTVQQQVVEERLQRIKVADVVKPFEVSVMPGISVAELIDGYLLPYNVRALPVIDGRLVGVVTIGDVMRVPTAARANVSVGEIMGGRDQLHSVAADSPVQDAIELLAEHDLDQVAVFDEDRFVGFLTRSDVMRQLQLREALDV